LGGFSSKLLSGAIERAGRPVSNVKRIRKLGARFHGSLSVAGMEQNSPLSLFGKTPKLLTGLNRDFWFSVAVDVLHAPASPC